MFYSSYCNWFHISVIQYALISMRNKKNISVFTQKYAASLINMMPVRYSKIDPGMWSSWNKNAFLKMESTSSDMLAAGFRFFFARSFGIGIKKMWVTTMKARGDYFIWFITQELAGKCFKLVLTSSCSQHGQI